MVDSGLVPKPLSVAGYKTAVARSLLNDFRMAMDELLESPDQVRPDEDLKILPGLVI
jgi:hypothetical protein